MATTSIQVYGDREEVKDLGVRLQSLMPSAQHFTNAEAMAVAQVAIAHQLDPFNGEVWGIKSQDGTWYGVMVGVKGLRKASNAHAKEEGLVYWKEFIQVQPAKYGEPDTSIVFECVIRDTATMQAYSKSLSTLVSAGAPYKEAVEMIGPAPRVVGIGIATPAEKSKMKITQRAKKRAEADGLKQRFDISFGAGVLTEGDKEAIKLAEIADSVDGEAEYVTDENAQAEPVEDDAPKPENMSKPMKRSIAQNLQELGFGTGEAAETDLPAATDAPKYKASGTKIVGIVAEIIGCEKGDAAKLILAKYPVSEMITEKQARDFAHGVQEVYPK